MDKKPLFIAGPCVIESAELLDTVAVTLADINRRLGVEIIFKASFDKACLLYTSPSPRDS